MDQINPEQSTLTPAQLDRQKKLDRFNRLTIYLPLGTLGLLVIGITGLMLWLTFFNNAESISEWRSFSSALADMIIIIAILPIMLFFALIPILAVGWLWYTSQSPRPVENWIQKWLRRSDIFLESSAEKVGSASKKAADLSIAYRETTTKFGAIIEQIWTFISRRSN